MEVNLQVMQSALRELQANLQEVQAAQQEVRVNQQEMQAIQKEMQDNQDDMKDKLFRIHRHLVLTQPALDPVRKSDGTWSYWQSRP